MKHVSALEEQNKQLVLRIAALEKANAKLEQSLAKEQEKTKTAIQCYKRIVVDYNALVGVQNDTAKSLNELLRFFILQCGILRTAITNEVTADPLAPVSFLQVTEDTKDLLYMLNGFSIIINALKEGKSVTEAIELWQEQI